MGSAREDLGRQLPVELLVPADLPAIAMMSETWRGLAGLFQVGGLSLSRIEVTHWRGSAADGWREAVRVEPGRWRTAAAAFETAAAALQGYASSVAAARAVAALARELWIEASSPLVHQLTPSPRDRPVTSSSPFDDPRRAQDHAVDLLESARGAVSQAGDIAAEAMAVATVEAPVARRFFEPTIRPAGGEEAMHLSLDVLGMLPLVGAVPDLANAGWYAAEDRYVEAGLSAVSAIPGLGDFAGGAVIAGTLAARGLHRLDSTALLLDGAREVDLGRGVAPGLVSVEGSPRVLDHVPYGFESRESWENYVRTIHDELAKAGYPDADVYLRGSAATGFRYRTGEFIGVTGPNDFDLAVASPELFASAKDVGVWIRGSRTVVVRPRFQDDLGLLDMVVRLSGGTEPETTVMIYRNSDAVIRRGDAIHLP